MTVPFLKPIDFDDPAIAAGFFGRQGGVSEGIYSTLNVGRGSDDDKAAVAENRDRVRRALGGDHLVTLYQVHSADCITLKTAGDGDGKQADAIVTDRPGIVIGALSADCGPVLFHGQGRGGKPIIASAHAGWGGALRGVLESTVAAMTELGADRDSIVAVIGPCIRQSSYEVSDNFPEPFLARDAQSQIFFKPGQPGKRQFDLPGYLRFRLTQAGVRRIGDCGIDTYKEDDDYFSFRRTTHRGEKDYGRQISALVIRA